MDFSRLPAILQSLLFICLKTCMKIIYLQGWFQILSTISTNTVKPDTCKSDTSSMVCLLVAQYIMPVCPGCWIWIVSAIHWAVFDFVLLCSLYFTWKLRFSKKAQHESYIRFGLLLGLWNSWQLSCIFKLSRILFHTCFDAVYVQLLQNFRLLPVAVTAIIGTVGHQSRNLPNSDIFSRKDSPH